MEKLQSHQKTNCFTLTIPAVSVLAICLFFTPAGLAATGTVNYDTVYQQIEGFGGAGCYDAPSLASHVQRTAIYNRLFSELGLDLYRIKNTYTFDSANITATGSIVDSAKSRNPQLKIELAPWSAPPGLKSNGSINGGTLAGGPDNYVYDDYANWWADSLTNWASYGVVPDYISIQNEPDIETSYDSCKFAPDQNTLLAGYNQAFEAVYNELYSRMGSSMPKMIGPETSGYEEGAYGWPARGARDYIDSLINQDHCYAFSFHMYSSGDGGEAGWDNPDSHLSDMADFSANYGYKPLIQNEYCRLNQTPNFDQAVKLAWHIHNALYHLGVTSYYHWTLFRSAGTGGMINIAGDTYTIRDLYWFFKHYAYFTDPNWFVVDVTTNPSDNLRMSVFKSPTGDKLTVVILNKSTSSESLTLDLNGCVVTNSQVYRSSETEHWVSLGGFTNPITLPAQSITTIAFDAADDEQTVAEVEVVGSWVSGLTHAKEAGNNRGLVFIAHGERGSSTDMNLVSVTYGGQAMTRVVERNAGTSSKVYTAAFILNEAGVAAATSSTFVPTWLNTPTNKGYASAFLQNVNQASLTGTTASNATTTGASISTSAIAAGYGDMVIDAATCSNTGLYTVNNGFTEIMETPISSADAVIGSISTEGYGETPSVTHSTSNGRQAIISFVVKNTPEASNPNPANQSGDVNNNPVLSWTAGIGATSHDVYFGTTNPPTFRGNQTGTTFSPGVLFYNTTYYWRIDEHNAGGTTTGDVWTFVTEPVSWWKFDETSGTTAYDSAGDNDGQLINGPAWTTGHINGGIGLDGVNDYISVPDNSSLRFDQDSRFTISLWAKPTSGGELVCKMRSTGSGIFGYEVQYDGTNKTFKFSTESSRQCYVVFSTPANSAPPGAWYYVTAVYDNGVLKLYLNGQLSASGDFTCNAGVTTPDKALAIGVRSFDSTLESYFNGTIDDLMIFNRTLSAEEIEQLYLGGPSEKASNPNPANQATAVDVNADLSWTAGVCATSHDVYFGTSNPPTFQVNQTGITYDPGTLLFGRTYYWRIDEHNAGGTTTGDVWSFSTGPAVFWQLDETSGTIANDTAGDNDGTFNGSDPCWVSGLVGGAADFNGVSDYFAVPSLDNAYGYQSTFSAAGWFRTTQTAGIQTIVGNWAQLKWYEYDVYDGWQIVVENNKVVARMGIGEWWVSDVTSTSNVTDGQWHHFAFVCPGDESNTILYVDGESEGTPMWPAIALEDTKFRIGDGSYIRSGLGIPVMKGGPFCGTIDEVMIYNKVLSAEEVNQLRQMGL